VAWEIFLRTCATNGTTLPKPPPWDLAGVKRKGKGVIDMNKIAKITALLVALVTVFSFSQESFSVPMEKLVVYDTVTVSRIVADSITLKEFAPQWG
jgi:hypothetical protein